MREWRVRCVACGLHEMRTRKPKPFGAFHWSRTGKCWASPAVSVREIGDWQPVETQYRATAPAGSAE